MRVEGNWSFSFEGKKKVQEQGKRCDFIALVGGGEVL